MMLSLYVVISLTIVALIIIFFFLIKHREKEEEAVDKLRKQEENEKKRKKPPKKLSATGTKKFWNIENLKEKSRHNVLNIFKPRKIGKDEFKSNNYKLKNLRKLSPMEIDINAHLSKIEGVHKDTPLSKLRKISKKSDGQYLKSLMEKEKQPEKTHPLQKLESLTDKRKRIIDKIKKIH